VACSLDQRLWTRLCYTGALCSGHDDCKLCMFSGCCVDHSPLLVVPLVVLLVFLLWASPIGSCLWLSKASLTVFGSVYGTQW